MKIQKLERKFGKEIIDNENIINQEIKDIDNKPKKINKILNIAKNTCVPFQLIKNVSTCELEKKYNYNLQFNSLKNENAINENYHYLKEYIDEVIKYIIVTESQNIFDYKHCDLFRLQDIRYINPISRKNIIESLIYQNYLWKLNNDSMFLAVNIMDRYTYLNKIKNKTEYELIGLTSFFIATKFEDIYPPDALSFCNIFSLDYNYEDILIKERQILTDLDFRLLYTSSYKVLNMVYNLSNINDINILNLSNLILELSLTNINIITYSQIKRAISSLILASKIFGLKVNNNLFRLIVGYDEKDLNDIISKLFIMLTDIVLSKELNYICEKKRAAKYNFIFSFLEKKIKDKIKKKIKKLSQYKLKEN